MVNHGGVEVFVAEEHLDGAGVISGADGSRGRKPRSMLFMRMFRCLSNNLCVHWILKQSRSHQKTTTDFFSAMKAKHHRYAFQSLFASHPAFSSPS